MTSPMPSGARPPTLKPHFLVSKTDDYLYSWSAFPSSKHCFKTIWELGCGSVAELMPGTHEALGSILSPGAGNLKNCICALPERQAKEMVLFS